jgi:hypothetical protein
MFRISRCTDGPIVDVVTFGQLVAALQSGKRGRFRIDELNYDLMTSGLTSRRWGVGIKWADGTVVIERDRAPSEPLGPLSHV